MVQLEDGTNAGSQLSSESEQAGISEAVVQEATGRHLSSKASRFHIILFAAILFLGILARTWEFGSLPPGLNQDEASDAVDAFSLYHYGMDANGNSLPAYLVSFGSGTSALYAYMEIPFIAFGGLNPFTVRLPMLIAGILTLPLIYGIGRLAINWKFGLISMFLLAISPWHILASRWALNANILPFVFSIAFLCLLLALKKPLWFIPAMLCMGISLYAYSPAYAAVPLFLVCALPVMVAAKKLRMRDLAVGLLVLAVVAAPIGLFLIINTFHFETVRLGSLTIPRLPIKPRYETQGVMFGRGVFSGVLGNLQALAQLLWTQVDGYNWNAFSPYGYFYALTFPIAVLGAILLAGAGRRVRKPEQVLLLAWLAAGISLGILQPPNINRINLVFIPLIVCVAAVMLWTTEHSKLVSLLCIAAFLIAFSLFARDYHGKVYKSVEEGEFFQGLLPAIDFAAGQGVGPICISDRVNMPYIYVMFSEPKDPRQYLAHIRYSNPNAQFRQVDHMDRYSFGLDKCPNRERPIYVLMNESLPQDPTSYKASTFDRFTVYTPEQPSQ